MRPDGANGKGMETPEADASTLALMAIGWTLTDQSRADRLLALTGLDSDDLRAGLGDPAILGAVLAFLADHEPDLIACAQAIGATPQQLTDARRGLHA